MSSVKHAAWLPKVRPIERSYRIGDISRLLGVAPHVVRFWEKQFRDFVRPGRSGPDHGAPPGRPAARARLYSARHLATLTEIRRLLYDEMYTIAGAKRQLRLAAERRAIDERNAADARESYDAEARGSGRPTHADFEKIRLAAERERQSG